MFIVNIFYYNVVVILRVDLDDDGFDRSIALNEYA